MNTNIDDVVKNIFGKNLNTIVTEIMSALETVANKPVVNSKMQKIVEDFITDPNTIWNRIPENQRIDPELMEFYASALKMRSILVSQNVDIKNIKYIESIENSIYMKNLEWSLLAILNKIGDSQNIQIIDDLTELVKPFTQLFVNEQCTPKEDLNDTSNKDL